MADRDRDDAGRARSNRPRDALGRPLAYGGTGVARAPEGIVRTPAQTVEMAQRLLDDGRPFHAHEVFEDAWKSASAAPASPTAPPAPAGPTAPPDDATDRALWKALAQLAVGMTHSARGNPAGHVALLARARAGLAPYAGRSPHGIDVDAVLAWIETSLAGGVAPLRLTGPGSSGAA